MPKTEKPQVPIDSMSRRRLLSGSLSAAALAGTVALGSHTVHAHGGAEKPGTAPAEPAQQRKAGIQLYTVRASAENDLHGTLHAMAGMNYQELEFAGYFGHDPAQIRKWLDILQMSSPSAHINARTLRDNPLELIEAAQIIGHRYLTIGWIEESDRQTLADWHSWAEILNRAGETCRAAGIKVAYHNHDFELLGTPGERPLDILLRETDPELVDFELDFYWVREAGKQVIDVLSQAPERFTMAHIKDRDSAGAMAEVGMGTIDFAGILTHPAAQHLQHLFVEHDNAADPFRSAAISRFTMHQLLD